MSKKEIIITIVRRTEWRLGSRKEVGLSFLYPHW